MNPYPDDDNIADELLLYILGAVFWVELAILLSYIL